MPQTPKNLTPEMLAAVDHWRWVEDQLRPIPEVTAPEDTAMWEEQILSQSLYVAERKRAEEAYIERELRRNRQRIIDKLKKETPMANQAPPVRPARTVDLQWLVDELNKPEALAKYRGEIAAGQRAIAEWHASVPIIKSKEEVRKNDLHSLR